MNSILWTGSLKMGYYYSTNIITISHIFTLWTITPLLWTNKIALILPWWLLSYTTALICMILPNAYCTILMSGWKFPNVCDEFLWHMIKHKIKYEKDTFNIFTVWGNRRNFAGSALNQYNLCMIISICSKCKETNVYVKGYIICCTTNISEQ